MVDEENGRSSHRGAIPRGGGLAVLLGVMVSLVLHSSALVEAGSILVISTFAIAFALLGLVDDIRGVAATIRLPFQVVLAGLFVAFSAFGRPAYTTIPIAFLVVVWVVGFVNAFNFMDGINGISVATTVIIGTSLAVTSYRSGVHVGIPAVALVGAALGFMPFNAPRARIFLGDVGSYFLGSGLALLSVTAIIGGASLLQVLLPFWLYLGDVAYTLGWRAVRRESLLASHRDHVYQRLTSPDGLTHTQTTLLVSLLTLVLVVAAQLSGIRGVLYQRVAILVGTAVVTGYLSLPLLSFQRSR